MDMLLNIFGFLNFSFVDVIDILLVAILIYLVFIWIRGSAAMNIFVAIILLLFLRVIAAAFNMKLTSALLGAFLDIGVLALIIIFQPEIRHFLMKFGSRYGFRGKGKDLINKLLGFKEQHIGNEAINELAEACRMSESYFRRVFTETMQMSPAEYINRFRINRAIYLLRTTDEPIFAVAEQSGFFSIATFNRNFRRFTGMSAQTWRETDSANRK